MSEDDDKYLITDSGKTLYKKGALAKIYEAYTGADREPDTVEYKAMTVRFSHENSTHLSMLAAKTGLSKNELVNSFVGLGVSELLGCLDSNDLADFCVESKELIEESYVTIAEKQLEEQMELRMFGK